MEKKQERRMTPQRKTVLEVLQESDTHPSADEIYALVRERLPNVSLGTIYRNLELLAGSGEIQKLEVGGTIKRYDWNPKKHYHIRCTRCGRVDDAPIAPLKQLENELNGATIYTITGHMLDFVGLCPACSKQTDAV